MVVALLALAGCSRAPMVVPGPRVTSESITVVEFDLDQANIHYQGVRQDLGWKLASAIAAELIARGYSADAIPGAAAPRGSATIRGSVLVVDERKPSWFGSTPCFAATGTVARDDGAVLAHFGTSRTAASIAPLRFAANLSQVDRCLRAVARDIAEMIETGQYRDLPS